MTDGQFHLFLSVIMWTCAAACVLNLLNLKRRGNSAFLLSAAYLTMGAIAWMVKAGVNRIAIIAAGVLLGGLLFVDFGMKARHQQDRPL
jgi:hypothetical protein